MSLELLTLSGFEGPEKVIEINLVPNIGPENNQGLRNLTEAEWTTILSAAHCNILCKKSNEYILSICVVDVPKILRCLYLIRIKPVRVSLQVHHQDLRYNRLIACVAYFTTFYSSMSSSTFAIRLEVEVGV